MTTLLFEAPLPRYNLAKNGRPYTASEKLSHMISQQKNVLDPAFKDFSPQQFQELLIAKPYMTEAEQDAIVRAVRTRELIYRVAEAVGRVRSTGVSFR